MKLENVMSSEVYLYRVQGSYDLRLRVFTSNPAEEIVISSQFLDPKLWYGIESILFSDGVSWSIEDIWSRTWSYGTDSSDTLTGTNYMDNFKGRNGEQGYLCCHPRDRAWRQARDPLPLR